MSAARTIYHSPQTPGYTSWVYAWVMPDNSIMVTFYQATGPADGRPRAPMEVQKKLAWPSLSDPHRDMTGLNTCNVFLRSTNGGATWHPVVNMPERAYYPKGIQLNDGRILVFAHIGSDDPYGEVDQSIVMDSFRLKVQ